MIYALNESWLTDEVNFEIFEFQRNQVLKSSVFDRNFQDFYLEKYDRDKI